MHAPSITRRPSQRGATLIEALMAFMVLSLGMLATARLQTHLRLSSDVARQRSEAMHLAQEDIETLRSFAAVNATPGLRSYADIASTSSSAAYSNARYEVTRHIDDSDTAGFKATRLTVHWADRTGSAQQMALHTIISGSNPALSAALTLPPNRDAVRSAFGRSAQIPLEAKDLGNGSSILKPAASGTSAFVFSNASGEVTAICASIDSHITTAQLTPSDLSHCSVAGGMLLSGQVRFSTLAPPNPAQANETPLPLTIELTLTHGPYPAAASCVSEAQKRVAFTSPAGVRRLAVPIDAEPTSVGAAEWTDLGDRFVAYHCAITPRNGHWSGRSAVVPHGWALGSGANQYKICRYTADQDGSGAIDSNTEHPDSYSEVNATLTQQNFLVIGGDQLCPTDNPLSVDVRSRPVLSSQNTVQHQP